MDMQLIGWDLKQGPASSPHLEVNLRLCIWVCWEYKSEPKSGAPRWGSQYAWPRFGPILRCLSRTAQAKPVISDPKQNGSPVRCQASVSLERTKIPLNLLDWGHNLFKPSLLGRACSDRKRIWKFPSPSLRCSNSSLSGTKPLEGSIILPTLFGSEAQLHFIKQPRAILIWSMYRRVGKTVITSIPVRKLETCLFMPQTITEAPFEALDRIERQNKPEPIRAWGLRMAQFCAAGLRRGMGRGRSPQTSKLPTYFACAKGPLFCI